MDTNRRFPHWLIGLGVSLVFVSAFLFGQDRLLLPVERLTFDLRAKLFAPEARHPEIELVVVTDKDLLELGPFPWSKRIWAQGIQNLALAGAKVIALDIGFSATRDNEAVAAVRRLKEVYENTGLAAKGRAGASFHKELVGTLNDLDYETLLINTMNEAGNVVLPISLTTLDRGMGDKELFPLSGHTIEGGGLHAGEGTIPAFTSLESPLPPFAASAAALGHGNLLPDEDGVVRALGHIVSMPGLGFIPSFPLAVVRVFKGLDRGSVQAVPGQGINMDLGSSRTVKVPGHESSMNTLVRWSDASGKAFHRTGFRDVFRNQIPTSLFRDKIVMVGVVAQALNDRFKTPVCARLPRVEIDANAVADLLEEDFFAQPSWVRPAEISAMVLFGLVLILLVPRLSIRGSSLLTAVLAAGYCALCTTVFARSAIWMKMSTPVLLLLVGFVLIVVSRYLLDHEQKEVPKDEPVETSKMIGLSYQLRGMPDLAFERYKSIPLENAEAKGLLYSVGLDFEARRSYVKALAAYERIAQDGTDDYRDLGERIPQLKHTIDTTPQTMMDNDAGELPADPALTKVDTKPLLGRFEVVEEIGRGAMGVVYKGRDPKNNRFVAIKAVRLWEFDKDIVDDIKRRFFREVETTRLLIHPNIVTIHSSGEAHGLAYMVMEYLRGENLSQYTHKDRLLPLRHVLDSVAHVADALEYAHSKHVVHQDIKPSNIFRMTGSGAVKVTDFGVVQTPSYMSPEQVAGRRIDGRSDIFSLGIVLFELLTGEKPFEGKDTTTLMLSISKGKHRSTKTYNKRIPGVMDKILDLALQKDPDRRYQRARQMAGHLRKVIAKIDEVSARKKQRS